MHHYSRNTDKRLSKEESVNRTKEFFLEKPVFGKTNA